MFRTGSRSILSECCMLTSNLASRDELGFSADSITFFSQLHPHLQLGNVGQLRPHLQAGQNTN
jgi:hypothetical protein